jgi:hypothetical protein
MVLFVRGSEFSEVSSRLCGCNYMANAIQAKPFCEATKNAHAPFNDHLRIYPVTLEHNNYAYPGSLCKIYIHVR